MNPCFKRTYQIGAVIGRNSTHYLSRIHLWKSCSIDFYLEIKHYPISIEKHSIITL